MKVGFIGLGHMGSGMASRLLSAGHEILAYNRTRSKAETLVEKGAHVAETIAEACVADAVITMLANDEAVEYTVFGPDGVLAHLPDGGIHISGSTISDALSRRLADAHAEKGQRYIAAPVLGRPEAAAAGKLFVLAAGPIDAVQRCEALFSAYGQKTFILGEEPSLANIAKLGGNFLVLSVIEALSEVLAFVGKAGIDPQQYLEILTSSLFAAPVYKTYGELILSQKFKPAGFAAPLGFKDIRLAIAAGERLRTPLPLASLIHDRFVALLASADGDQLDWSAISQLSARDAGLPNALV